MPSPRQTVLASRHKALGSELGDWNDMDVPWEYNQDVNLEALTVRKHAGLFDVSGIKKIHIIGSDAVAVADHVCTRDITKLTPGQSTLGIILNDEGHIVDDCMVFYMMPNHLMLLHGGGIAMQQLEKSAAAKDVEIKFDDDMHITSLQGPKALSFLNQHTSFELSALKNSHHQATTIFNRPCLISRTGYSNENGYEIFAKAEDTTIIWDAIITYGKNADILPCSFNCIDIIRIEAGLYFFPYDMQENDTPWDVSYGFAIDLDKSGDYRGKQNLLAAKGKESSALWSVILDTDKAVAANDALFDGNKKIGYVTAPCYSPIMQSSIAVVRIDKEYATAGKKLFLKGADVSCNATTGTMPLYKPKKATD